VIPQPLVWCSLGALLSVFVAAGLVPATAQEGSDLTAVQPIEDLQGRFHFTPEDLVNILSTNSLMLTHNQIVGIEDAKDVAREQTGVHEEFAALTQDASSSRVLNRDNFQLDAIMYLSRQRWTFWLNGEAVTPDLIPQGINVLQVTPYLVELTWTPDASRPDSARRFVLEPGQAYLVGDGAVVESDEVAGRTQDQPQADDTAQSGDETGDSDSANDEDSDGGSADNAAPGGLALAPQQVEQLAELQQALAIVSGNAAALGMTEEELQQLQQSLAASGDTSTLSAEQQEQLQRIQQATGIE
jgi:hypothetical protein